MAFDVGDVAGLIAGFKAGQITEREMNRLLREWDLTGDRGVDRLLSVVAGLGVGALTGSIVNDVVDGLFDW